jgi:1-acyl-sn-glycerol-3-phosphate acyltransferase
LLFFVPQSKLDPWVKRRLKTLFQLLHSPVEVIGADKIQSGISYLFMANHLSAMDVPLLQAYIPTYVRGVLSEDQFHWPIYGYAMRKMGNISINREKILSSFRSMQKSENLLKVGHSLALMPEAHRTLDGNMLPFKKLPFYLAKNAGADLVPIGLSGLFNLKRKGSWHINPTPITIHFGDIIPWKKIQRMSIQELRDKTRQQIENLIEKPIKG